MMKRILWLSVITFACVLALTNSKPHLRRASALSLAQEPVKVETFVLPGIPLSFKKAKATTLNDKTVLTYSLRNETGDSVAELRCVMFILGGDGLIKGGEGWILRPNLAAGLSYEVPIALQHDISPEDRLLLTVYKVNGPSTEYVASPGEVIRAVRSKLSNNAHVINAHAGAKAYVQQATGPCADAQAFAERVCTCGIQSFNCNPTTGAYSFQCFGAGGPKCPKTVPS